jgi:hypothetical protein
MTVVLPLAVGQTWNEINAENGFSLPVHCDLGHLEGGLQRYNCFRHLAGLDNARDG